MWSHFDANFKRWAQRPAATGGDEAARRVTALIRERRGPAQQGLRGWREKPFAVPRWGYLAALSAGGLLVASVFLWTLTLRDVRTTEPTSGGAEVRQPEGGIGVLPQDDNVVLYWLDSRTPVYFVMDRERRTR